MKTSFQIRLVAVILAVLTLAAVGLAIGNLVQETGYDVPTDGVVWTETIGGLRADIVPTDSPAARAGVHRGDVLTALNDGSTPRLADAERAIGTDPRHASHGPDHACAAHTDAAGGRPDPLRGPTWR